MAPTSPQPSAANRPRVGIPWRISDDEDKARSAGPKGKIGKTEDYLKAVEKAGGEGIIITLKDEVERNRLIPTLDAFVLPGSQADVEPGEYGAANQGLSQPADPLREETDRAVLKHALTEKKPVLAICYGFQMLNVYRGGSLIQDLQTELKDQGMKLERHRKKDAPPSAEDPWHAVTLEPDTRLIRLATGPGARVNSSHHQAINKLGRDLKIAARATDGIIEGVEWTGDSNWVVGVQWHPERMPGNAFAERLFREFVAAAASVRNTIAHKT
jgi:putative glutamine amidotransferase